MNAEKTLPWVFGAGAVAVLYALLVHTAKRTDPLAVTPEELANPKSTFVRRGPLDRIPIIYLREHLEGPMWESRGGSQFAPSSITFSHQPLGRFGYLLTQRVANAGLVVIVNGDDTIDWPPGTNVMVTFGDLDAEDNLSINEADMRGFVDIDDMLLSLPDLLK